MSQPTRILFVGNSFTNRNDLPGMLTRMAAAARPPRRVETERVIANGRALKTHWERGTAVEAIRGSRWDFVVLQEQSTLPLKNPARMLEYVTLFDGEIQKAGAKTVLYMTWARRHEFGRRAELAKAYNDAGRAVGAIVVPAGLAWQRILSEHPEIVLHDKDNSHPTLAGSYLAACAFFATLFGQSPAGLATTDGAGLERFGAEMASMLQDAAWRTVRDIAGAK